MSELLEEVAREELVRHLSVEKRDLTQASLHRGLLVKGQALLVKPGAAKLTAGPLMRMRASTASISLGARALTHQLPTPRDPPSPRTRLLVRQPDHVERADDADGWNS